MENRNLAEVPKLLLLPGEPQPNRSGTNLPALLGLVLGTSTMGVLSTYLMNALLAEDNPGYVICAVSGTNNIVVYLLGSLFYGRLDALGVLGAVLVGAGIALITYAKQAPAGVAV